MVVTASAIERITLCAASAAFPQGEDVSSGAASRGTKLHNLITPAIERGETVAECEEGEIDLQPLHEALGAPAKGEMALVYDTELRTARFVGHYIDRNYGEANPMEIGVTSDLSTDADTLVEIKTGSIPVPPPDSNPQIKTQAVALSSFRRLTSVKASLAVLDNKLKWKPIETVEFDALDLGWIADDLRALMIRVNQARDQVARGETPDTRPSWTACRWCRAINCPSRWERKSK